MLNPTTHPASEVFYNHRKAYWDGLKIPILEFANCQTVSTNGPTGWLNGVISINHVDQEEESFSERVQAITTFFKEKNLPFSWWIEANQEPRYFAEVLHKHQFFSLGDSKGLVFNLEHLVKIEHPHLVVEEVSTQEDMKEMVDVLLDAYKESAKTGEFAQKLFWSAIAPAKVIHFIGRNEGKPVTAGTLFIDQEVARIFHVGTIQEARKKTYGSCLISSMHEKAKSLGCKISALVSTPKGLGMYKRLGYVEKGLFHHYMKA